jgi:hypothetical protein
MQLRPLFKKGEQVKITMNNDGHHVFGTLASSIRKTSTSFKVQEVFDGGNALVGELVISMAAVRYITQW